MSTRGNRQMRVDRVFKEDLENIMTERLKKGLDKRPKSSSRLTAAMRRHKLFPKIKEDILMAELAEKDIF